jgi:hypothetical protein
MLTSIKPYLLLSAGAIAAICGYPARAAWAAPDDTLGVAIMSASVKRAGTLHHGTGVTSVQRMSAGVYEITFERDITACTCVASLGGVDGTASYFSGWHLNANCPPFKVDEPVNPKLAQVSTTRDLQSSYSPTDADFHMIVFCPR